MEFAYEKICMKGKRKKQANECLVRVIKMFEKEKNHNECKCLDECSYS